MTRDDDPTRPLPEVGEPTGPTQPLVAPHVPIADVPAATPAAGTPEFASARRRGPGTILLVVGGLAAVAAAIAVVAGLGTLRGPVPLETGSPSPSVSDPSPTAPSVVPDDPVAPSDPADPAPPSEPSPTPTTEPTVPPVEPTTDPTPLPTP